MLLALLYRKGVSEKKRKLGSFYFLAKSSQVYLAIQSKLWVTRQEGKKNQPNLVGLLAVVCVQVLREDSKYRVAR